MTTSVDTGRPLTGPTGAHPVVPGTVPWRAWLRGGWTAQALASGLLYAVLVHLRWGYAAGDRDHLVLAPVGMQWAHPDWFRGDWAMAAAPQPHWLFDIVTWFGSATGTLGAVYLLYWLAAMLAFGTATALLAHHWTPNRSWLAVIVVTVGAVIAPLYLFGSGAALYATGLPNVLGGGLVYLIGAALLVGRHRLAAGTTILCSLVHVQNGTIAVVLLLMVAVYHFLRTRQVEVWLLVAAAVGLLILVVDLRLRPVAGDIGDFATICDQLIPYHCNATSWSKRTLISSASLLGLALMSVLYLKRDQRWRWLLVLVLPAVALVGGVVVDYVNLPVLGELVQGVNIYRLSVLLQPFAVWGAMTPIFADLAPRWRWATLGAVGVLGEGSLVGGNWGVLTYRDGSHGVWPFVFGALLVAGCAALTVPDLVRRPAPVPGLRARLASSPTSALAGAFALSLLAAGFFGQLGLRSFDPRVHVIGDLNAWGQDVQRVVPEGGLIVVPPRAVAIRMATHRAVVVDCKYGPYGGEPWQEFQTRLNDLGGFGQCASPATLPPYGRLTVAELAAVTKRYGTDFIVVETPQTWRISGLEAAGWTVAVPGRGSAKYALLKAPGR